MRIFGTTARRIVYAILLTALIPVVSSLLVSRAIIARVSATAVQPEFAAQLDRSLAVYADLARALKQGMRAEAQAITAREALSRAALAKDAATTQAELDRAFEAHASLSRLSVETCDGRPLAQRERPTDPTSERTLTVRRALGEGGDGALCDPNK